MNYKKHKDKKINRQSKAILLLSSMVISFILCMGFYFKVHDYVPLIVSFFTVLIFVITFVLIPHKRKGNKYKEIYHSYYRNKSSFDKGYSKKDTDHFLFENDIVPIYVSDKNHCILRVNKAFENETGYSINDVIGKKYQALTTKLNDKSTLNKLWKDLDDHGKWSGVLDDKKKCGTMYKKKSFVKRINDHNGRPKKYISMFYKYS